MILALVHWVEGRFYIHPNSLIKRTNPAEDLERWLESFKWSGHRGLEGHVQMPHYKYYGEVINILLGLARKLGGSYHESFLYLREGLQLDQQFEKKVKEVTWGLYLQMGMMMVLTWIFIFLSLRIVNISMSSIHLLAIFCWELLGLFSLPVILRSLRKRYFGDIGKLWQVLFILRALQKIPLSRSEVFRFAGVKSLSEITQKKLSPLVSKLKETAERALKLGASYEEDINYLMGELRFQEKWHFELFEKRLVVIKLVLLSVFFLPSYLAFIFLLLGDLMDLM